MNAHASRRGVARGTQARLDLAGLTLTLLLGLMSVATTFGPAPLGHAHQTTERQSPMVRLLPRVPESRRGTILEMIGKRGTPADLKFIYNQLLDADGFSEANRLKALEALEAAALRGVEPDTIDGNGLATVITETGDPAIQLAAIRLAARWEIDEAAEPLGNLAADPDQPRAVRQAALKGLATIGGEAARSTIATLLGPDQPQAVRCLAVAALVRIDRQAGIDRAVKVLGQGATLDELTPVITAILGQQGGAEAFAGLINERGLPVDVAKLALRALYAAGRSDVELVRALTASAGLNADARPLTAEEMTAMITRVTRQGNPAHGERIFRRSELACMNCHAVAKAGGNIGPALDAIGVSSPVDYIVNSILMPAQAVKEEYQMLTVLTFDGLVVQGLIVSENDEQVVLKDAQGELITLAADDIEDERRGGSLMPEGLTNLITQDEFVDLIAFLSELGKPQGDYAIRSTPTIQTWRVLVADPEEAIPDDPDESFRAQVMAASEADYRTAYSLVDGRLPLGDLVPETITDDTPITLYLQGAVEVSIGGYVTLQVEGDSASALWIDDEPALPADRPGQVRLALGRHLLTLRVDFETAGQVRRDDPNVRLTIDKDEGATTSLTVVEP